MLTGHGKYAGWILQNHNSKGEVKIEKISNYSLFIDSFSVFFWGLRRGLFRNPL